MEHEFQPVPGTQTIDRAAQLLTLVLQADGPRPLSDLAGDAALPKSTASRLLNALERQGLVHQHGERGAFGPGPVLIRFAHRGLVERHLAELAQPHLEALSQASGETINLAVPTPLGVEHLAQVESRHYLGTGQWVGRRVPYHCTAVGKVLLATGAAALPGGPLERLAPATIVDHDRLSDALAEVRRAGYATATDELELGLSSLAAPVLGAGAAGLAALSISGPTVRLQPARMAQLRPILIHEARALSERLGEHDTGVHAA